MSSANGSTTPLDPPPNWGVSPVQPNDNFNWAHLPPQFSASQQPGNEMPDMLDPAVFNSLAELLNQSNGVDLQQQMQQQATQQQQQESYDLLAALTQVQNQNQNHQPVPMQVGSQNSNSASLLTRRMQQGPTQPQQQYSRPGSISGSTHGTPTTSSTPQYPSPSYSNYQQNTVDSASLGRLPTPPQTFHAMFTQQQKASSNPTTPWPLPDRQVGYSGTPVTTPGGEFGYTSPIEVSPVNIGHELMSDCTGTITSAITYPASSSRSTSPPSSNVQRDPKPSKQFPLVVPATTQLDASRFSQVCQLQPRHGACTRPAAFSTR
jgi:hypothetical protein